MPVTAKNGAPDEFALVTAVVDALTQASSSAGSFQGILSEELLVQPTKEVYKPDNQLQLVEKDLQEETAKMLTANNPAAPKNTARFNMKERVYKLEPMVDQLLVHYTTDGWLMHKASEDARKQQEVEKQVEEATVRFQNEVSVSYTYTLSQEVCSGAV